MDDDVTARREQYRAAVKAVLQLAEHDVRELRSYARPPATVAAVLAAVALILGLPTDWRSLLTHLHDSEQPLMGRITAFDVTALKPAQGAQLADMLESAELDPTRARATSAAACSLCCWAHAVHRHAGIDSVRREVQRKQRHVQRQREAAQV